MSAPKFTPGPWIARQVNGHGRGWSVGPAWIGENTWLPEAEANARLIAAAPDLLAACADLLQHASLTEHMSAASVERARAAIAKATGGQP